MREDHVEAVKLALLDLLEGKGPSKAVMLYELGPRLPEGLTDEEYQKALEDLKRDHFALFEDFKGNAYRARFVRGAAYQKWVAQIHAPKNTTWNVSGTFSGPTQLGDGTTQNIQINESDSKQLIALIEKIVADPKAKDKASPILEALKDGAIDTAKEGIKALLKIFLGTP